MADEQKFAETVIPKFDDPAGTKSGPQELRHKADKNSLSIAIDKIEEKLNDAKAQLEKNENDAAAHSLLSIITIIDETIW